jgi:tRNA (guanine26-N2/guanine27-N2)-dimethyltransferase
MGTDAPEATHDNGTTSEWITEGKARIARKMRSTDGQRELEAFYNPVQRFNRDLTLLVCLLHGSNAKTSKPDRSVTYCDAFTATGLRAIRTSLELPRSVIDEIVACDLSSDAVRMARNNLIANQIDLEADGVSLKHRDCNAEFLERSSDGLRRFDIVDLDPFGSSLPFLRQAIQACRHGGMVAATFTDLRVIEGSDYRKLYSLYGSQRGSNVGSKEEVSLRLVLASANAEANKVGKTIRPLLSVWKHFYLRVGYP